MVYAKNAENKLIVSSKCDRVSRSKINYLN